MKNYKATFAAMVGNALEYYDAMLYGYFATILAPLFFPVEDQALSVISSLGTFAAGFVMRPVGGIIFGYLGDKFGRRFALVLAIFLVTIPTLTIGLLPTYGVIGILAPITLIVCRLLQGLCVGGEYTGASIFVIEYSKRGKEAFAGSILAASGIVGGVIGTFFGFLCTLPFMPEWGWRIPFLIGSLIGLIGYYIRKNVNESPDFLNSKKEKKKTIPLLGIFQEKKRNLLCTVGIGAATLIPFYVTTVYMGYVLSTRLNLPPSQIMLMHVFVNLFSIFLLPFFGLLADKIGKEKQMLFSALILIFAAYPLFSFLEADFTIPRVIILQIIVLTLNLCFVAPSMALLSSYYSVHERYSGIGFGYALGGALLGGTTPVIITSLVNWFDTPLMAAYYLILCGFIGAMSVLWGEKTHGVLSKTKAVVYEIFPRLARA